MNTDQNPFAHFSEHLEVTDALYRLSAGIDHNDTGLIASAFSEAAMVDFGPYGRKMGKGLCMGNFARKYGEKHGAGAKVRTSS